MYAHVAPRAPIDVCMAVVRVNATAAHHPES